MNSIERYLTKEDARAELLAKRIVLAKAMGWSRFIPRAGIGVDGKRECSKSGWLRPDGRFAANYIGGAYPIPDPFSDAGDDVAVLDWAREQLHRGDWTEEQWHLFVGGLGMIHEYRVGKFAESALYVLKYRNG